MNLDPCCPQQHLPKHSPNRCIFCEYGAAVREDEARLIAPNLDTHWQRGYAKGRADAAADVAAAPILIWGHDEFDVVDRDAAVAAARGLNATGPGSDVTPSDEGRDTGCGE